MSTMENTNPKIPTTVFPVADFVTARWSPRAFSAQAISQDTLHTLLEAASWAPSSMNEQPWVFCYAHRGSPEFQQYFDCLMPGNQGWANRAAVLVLALAHKTFPANGKPNRHAMFDTGAAVTTLLMQAASLDIYGHIMGGFDMVKAHTELGIPDSYEISSILALGYIESADTLEEPFKARELQPRSRKPLAEFVFEGKLPG
jgi:nitroreductase